MVFLSNSPSLQWWSPLFRVLRKLLMCGLCGQTWRPGDISPKSPTRATQMSDPLAARRIAWERLVGRCPWNKRHVCLFVCLFDCLFVFFAFLWLQSTGSAGGRDPASQIQKIGSFVSILRFTRNPAFGCHGTLRFHRAAAIGCWRVEELEKPENKLRTHRSMLWTWSQENLFFSWSIWLFLGTFPQGFLFMYIELFQDFQELMMIFNYNRFERLASEHEHWRFNWVSRTMFYAQKGKYIHKSVLQIDSRLFGTVWQNNNIILR